MCHLYGPTIVHEDKKGQVFFENLSVDHLTDDEKLKNGVHVNADKQQRGANGIEADPGINSIKLFLL